jgi:TonB family protein
MKRILAIVVCSCSVAIAHAQSTVADSISKLDSASQRLYEQQLRLTAVEEEAEFEGGQEGLYKFLNTNLKYPKHCLEKGIEGRTKIEFMVCTDGSICNFAIVQSSGSRYLDDEAIRVVRKIDKAKPARIKGQPVSSYFTLPISFTLQ